MKSTETDRHKAEYIPVRVSAETKQLIAQLAAQRGLTMSEIMRDLLEKGLIAVGAKVDEETLTATIREVVADTIKPSVERLAAISAKATQISSAAFFMSIFEASRGASDAEQAAIAEAAESARALGIQYLKLRDRDIDGFIADGARQIIDN